MKQEKLCNSNVIFKKNNKYSKKRGKIMEGEFKVRINNRIFTYNNTNDIPNEIGAVISFKPDYPEPPHTEEQHNYISTFESKLKQLMERECLRLRG